VYREHRVLKDCSEALRVTKVLKEAKDSKEILKGRKDSLVPLVTWGHKALKALRDTAALKGLKGIKA
jgi:hypothetical protein